MLRFCLQADALEEIECFLLFRAGTGGQLEGCVRTRVGAGVQRDAAQVVEERPEAVRGRAVRQESWTQCVGQFPAVLRCTQEHGLAVNAPDFLWTAAGTSRTPTA